MEVDPSCAGETQKCSVQVWNVDVQNCGNETSSEPLECRLEHVTTSEIAFCTTDLIKKCDEVSATVIKSEQDNEDTATTQKLNMKLWQDSTDTHTHIINGDNLLTVTEDVIEIKQELDIGPTMLQPRTVPCSLLSPIEIQICPLSSHPSASSNRGIAPVTPCTSTKESDAPEPSNREFIGPTVSSPSQMQLPSSGRASRRPHRLYNSPRAHIIPRRLARRATTKPRMGELAQLFLCSEAEWRKSYVEIERTSYENEREQLRLRKMELALQKDWQALGHRLLDILGKLVNKLCED